MLTVLNQQQHKGPTVRPPDLKCSSENVIYYLHIKYALNNIQGAQKIFG